MFKWFELYSRWVPLISSFVNCAFEISVQDTIQNTGTASLKSVNESYYLRFEYMKNLKLSRRGYLIGKFDMETSGEKENSDLFVHELECSDQVICLHNMY